MRLRPICVAVLGTLLLAAPAAAQDRWSGLYVGGSFGGAFQTVHFTVDDASQPPVYRPVDGATTHGLMVGGLVGFDKLIGGRVVVGAEGSFGVLRYKGETLSFSIGNDTVAKTEGDIAWHANGHIGIPFRQVMPFVSFGVLGSRNAGSISDTCNLPPCGSSVGEGGGEVWDTRFVVGFGVNIAGTNPIAGHRWAIRLDWLVVPGEPVANDFSRTVSGIGIPAGTTRLVAMRTELPPGMLMATFVLGLGK